MSGSTTTPCSNQALLQLNTSSPTSKQRPQRLHVAIGSATSESADLVVNKFIHIDSPRSSASLFKRPGSPAAAKPYSKWKAVLAHLTPPRLLSAARRTSTKSRLSPKHSGTRSDSSSATSALVTDRAVPVSDAAAPIPDIKHVGSIEVDAVSTLSMVGTESIPDNSSASRSSSSISDPDAVVDVQQLLQTLQRPLSSSGPADITARSDALTTMSCLCVASPSTADQYVVAGGIEIILNILNSSSDLPVDHAVMVEESEKALLLLQQLLTFSPTDGSAAALEHSSLLISTVGKKLLRVSETCTASVIAILTLLGRRPEAASFCKALSDTAIPSKLVVVLQVAFKESTKRRAGRLLRLLGEQQQQQQQQ